MSRALSTRPPPPPVTWSCDVPTISAAWITQAKLGEMSSGDAVVARAVDGGVLVGIVDALGHGPKANDIATLASKFLDQQTSCDVASIIAGLHQALVGTRGAAALVMAITEESIDVCSVGNVGLRSTNSALTFMLTPGVLGSRLRTPKVCRTRRAQTRLVIHSDGISGRFDLKAQNGLSPDEIATHIFAGHRYAHDDATVFVMDLAAPSK